MSATIRRCAGGAAAVSSPKKAWASRSASSNGGRQERLTLLAPGGEAPRFITLERRWERVDGGALEAMIAHTGDPDQPIVRWDKPVLLRTTGAIPRSGMTTRSRG